MSNDNLQIDVAKLNLEAVRIEKASVEHPPGFNAEAVTGFAQEVSQTVALNMEDERYRLRFSIEVSTKMKSETTSASGAFSLLFYFKVNDLKNWVVIDENKSEYIHQMLATTLFSIAYSTARGILLTRFQGTVFSNFVLPIINPATIFQNNRAQ